MKENKIIIIELVSKILLPISLFLFILARESYGKFFCFGKDVTSLVIFSFFWILLLSIALEIATLLIRLKLGLPLRDSIKSFLKVFLVILLFSLFSYLFVSNSVPRHEARDWKRLTDLRQIYTAQELFYQGTGRYTNSQDELVEKGYFPEPLKDPLTGKEYADEKGMLDGGDDNPATWAVQVVLERGNYERELCGGKKPTRIFFCSQAGCEYLSEE